MDSRVILDQPGAERCWEGRYAVPGARLAGAVRLQGCSSRRARSSGWSHTAKHCRIHPAWPNCRRRDRRFAAQRRAAPNNAAVGGHGGEEGDPMLKEAIDLSRGRGAPRSRCCNAGCDRLHARRPPGRDNGRERDRRSARSRHRHPGNIGLRPAAPLLTRIDLAPRWLIHRFPAIVPTGYIKEQRFTGPETWQRLAGLGLLASACRGGSTPSPNASLTGEATLPAVSPSPEASIASATASPTPSRGHDRTVYATATTPPITTCYSPASSCRRAASGHAG